MRRIPLETLKIDGFARRCIMHICADLDSIPRQYSNQWTSRATIFRSICGFRESERFSITLLPRVSLETIRLSEKKVGSCENLIEKRASRKLERLLRLPFTVELMAWIMLHEWKRKLTTWHISLSRNVFSASTSIPKKEPSKTNSCLSTRCTQHSARC